MLKFSSEGERVRGMLRNHMGIKKEKQKVRNWLAIAMPSCYENPFRGFWDFTVVIVRFAWFRSFGSNFIV